ncbi:MAG TPA: type II toxin-antitoxin system RelE/ParE family toxin [Prolixibacteraceae bacterium]
MPRSKVASILWTERSLQNAISIKEYLLTNFSGKEVDHFYAMLQSFEIAVCAFPELYPQSFTQKNIRRAVLSKVLSAYYRIHKGKIEVVALLDNRCDISNWL